MSPAFMRVVVRHIRDALRSMRANKNRQRYGESEREAARQETKR